MDKQYSSTGSLCTVTFSLPAEAVGNATSVMLLGDFNDWDWRKGIMLEKQDDGSFSKELELATGQNYQFRYVLDHQSWVNDWQADSYVASPYTGIENCVVDLSSEQPAPVAEKKPKAKKATRARGKKAAADGDKLTKIEGIGPKIEGLLKAEEIKTFDTLAGTSPDRIKEILLAAGSRYKMFDPTTWPEQAKLASEERWDELKTLQDELKGGKR